MLRELDVSHERVVVDISAGEQNSPDYRAINPMGKVPALVDGDVIVTETAAICAYLADKFADKGLAPPHHDRERGRYYRYLFFPGVTLEPLLSVTALGVTQTRPESMGWGDMPRVLAAVEAMTPEATWALGPQFSAADVVFGGALAFFSDFKLLDASPKVERYVARLNARPA
jgi:glutathione S-transferase